MIRKKQISLNPYITGYLYNFFIRISELNSNHCYLQLIQKFHAFTGGLGEFGDGQLFGSLVNYAPIDSTYLRQAK